MNNFIGSKAILSGPAGGVVCVICMKIEEVYVLINVSCGESEGKNDSSNKYPRNTLVGESSVEEFEDERCEGQYV